MFSKKELKNYVFSILSVIAFAIVTVSLVACEEAEDALTNTVCEDIPISCNRSIDYKACANGSGDSWYELNGTRYDDVNTVVAAAIDYCD